MAKRKAKRVKKTTDLVTESKLEKLQQLLKIFKSQTAEYEDYLNSQCVENCSRIEKVYKDRLTSIPERIRNMTVSQVLELQEKARARQTECPRDENAIRMQHERQKITSEQKRTQRKDKKRSISAPPSARGLSNVRHPPSNIMPRISRNVSELSLLTPVGKAKKPSMVVTPKFNPKFPVVMARKPKPGEILMSLSGSPLHNYLDDLPPDKPSAKVTLSLGHGKVITFGPDAELESDTEFLKALDEPLKNTIQDVQKKLNKILQT